MHTMDVMRDDALERKPATPVARHDAAVPALSAPIAAWLQRVDLDGAHTRTLTFPRPAPSTEELGDLLRRELHAGLC